MATEHYTPDYDPVQQAEQEIVTALTPLDHDDRQRLLLNTLMHTLGSGSEKGMSTENFDLLLATMRTAFVEAQAQSTKAAFSDESAASAHAQPETSTHETSDHQPRSLLLPKLPERDNNTEMDRVVSSITHWTIHGKFVHNGWRVTRDRVNDYIGPLDEEAGRGSDYQEYGSPEIMGVLDDFHTKIGQTREGTQADGASTNPLHEKPLIVFWPMKLHNEPAGMVIYSFASSQTDRLREDLPGRPINDISIATVMPREEMETLRQLVEADPTHQSETYAQKIAPGLPELGDRKDTSGCVVVHDGSTQLGSAFLRAKAQDPRDAHKTFNTFFRPILEDQPTA